MAKTIVVSNQKGGVGKTTTVINLAFEVAKHYRVLVIDLDPQGNCASGMGVEVKLDINLYRALSEAIPLEESIYKTPFKNLHLIPGTEDLAGAEIELSQIKNPEIVLKKKIASIKNHFDYIFLDTPPAIGMLTLNALVAAESVLIPIQCEYYALEGISLLLKNIKRIKKVYNPSLRIEGIVLTMYDHRTNLSKDVVLNIKNHFTKATFKTLIIRNIKISESPSYGLPVGEYDSKSSGAICYQNLAKEFIKKNVT